ncbi:MAG: hypothetical protein AUI14_20100 [Actinobacteria bacterium 13_2_20CM_2_71_6]|nr:MAG: hypothetical protein AUI14_20100 [Actinobacteria bacterium 13_2_20CM_2_71_6]
MGDWSGDTNLPGGGVAPAGYGDIAFTNLPYVRDVGFECGQNYVNSGGAGNLDGFSIIAGHEYAETITDQNPPGGWVADGGENGDKCSWIGTSGVQGGAANVALGTGTFAMQGTWSNAFANQGGCEITRPLVTVTYPGDQLSRLGQAATPVSFPAYGGYPSYTMWASGLSPGLSFDPSSGTVSGTPTQLGDFQVIVNAVDSQGFFAYTVIIWSVRIPQVVVPNVRGQDPDAAAATLAAVNLGVGQEVDQVDTTCRHIGTVMQQVPMAGVLVEQYSQVTLYVGTPPPPRVKCH